MRTVSANGRFYESGGVIPQTVLWGFSSALPARPLVSPHLYKAPGTVEINKFPIKSAMTCNS